MFKTVILMAVLSMSLTACVANDGQRAIIGAAAGAVAADATGNNAAVGAGLGAVAGLIIK
jgi:osmotically inducible lipoprotein OsmB